MGGPIGFLGRCRLAQERAQGLTRHPDDTDAVRISQSATHSIPPSSTYNCTRHLSCIALALLLTKCRAFVPSEPRGASSPVLPSPAAMLTPEQEAHLHELARHVMRSFYEPKYIIALDQLIRKPL
jgi:hypothetical protein